MKLDQVIQGVLTLRRDIEARKQAHKDELAPLNLKMEKLEAFLQLQLTTMGVTSFASTVGTAYLQNTVSVTIEDWQATLDWVKSTELWEMLERRVSKTVVQEYMEAQNQIPPGVKVRTEVEVRVRTK